MPRFLRSFPLVCLILTGHLALAQKGDKRGEEQKPLPADVKIPPAPVLSPEDERATFTLAPGFHAELIAADPLIGDPVAMQFAPDGRLWVLEMRGYMPNADGVGEREPVGVIAVLEDTDGDGRYDKRSEFVDHLVLPRAFALVGDGVLVGEPTNLWYFRDTDGDGKADSKTSIATDYGNTNNPEHNATDERFRPVNLYNGPDGALYVVHPSLVGPRRRTDRSRFCHRGTCRHGDARGTLQ